MIRKIKENIHIPAAVILILYAASLTIRTVMVYLEYYT